MSNRKKLKIEKVLLYLFIAAILGLAAVIYVFPTLTGALTPTSIVEYGNLRVASDETCYFVRNEKVIAAASSGSIQYYCEEGELVRKGTKILDILPGGGSHTASENSLISYYIDGLEEVLTPTKISTLKKEEVESLDMGITHVKRQTAVAGEVLYKTVDSNNWYAALYTSPENVIKYVKGKTVYINLPLGQIKGSINDIIDCGSSWLVILKFTRYYEEMQKIRKLEAEVVTSDYEGLIIANKSITTREGKTGVYVKDIVGEFVFTPVSVVTSDGEYSLVENGFFYEKNGDESVKVKTVNAYDEILNYPEKK